MDLFTFASFEIIIFLVQKLNSLKHFLVLLKPTIMHLVFQGFNFIHWFYNTCIYMPMDQKLLSDLLKEIPLNIFL
jgi:hypothetical protein